jgi:hypothetical protein
MGNGANNEEKQCRKNQQNRTKLPLPKQTYQNPDISHRNLAQIKLRFQQSKTLSVSCYQCFNEAEPVEPRRKFLFMNGL